MALFVVAFLAACGSDETANDVDAVPTCDRTEATVCITQIASLGGDAAIALDLAVELDADSPVAVAAGACGAGGNEPNDLTWSLCWLTLDDGRQIVLGRSADAETMVRANVAHEAIDFPLATAIGEATVLNTPTQTFVIVNADGDEIGSTFGA
jgi:hypothetical protein